MRGKLTQAQNAAIEWLAKHRGDGCFDKTGVLLAAGERAPFMRSTWNILRVLGYVEFYQGGGRAWRVRLVVRP